MLGLILLLWIGKYFYRLAEEYNKNKWGIAILGVASHYMGTFIFGVVFGIVAEIVSPGYVNTMNNLLLGIIALPFGALNCYIVYNLLERIWKKRDTYVTTSIV